MDREELTRIAREAGIRIHKIDDMHLHQISTRLLERFASLVAAAERERCAKVCDQVQSHHQDKMEITSDHDEYDFREAEACGAEDCAAAIRALP